jgi:serine/threonine-protein kinase RsbW
MTAVDPDNESTFRELVVASDLREACAPKQAVLTELERCGYDEGAVFAMKLALEEALTNAVKHGNRSDPGKKVTVRYGVGPEKAVVIVRDEGPGFIPEGVPDCTCEERLSVPSGRGIMLIRAYMDEVSYRDQGREICFVKRRSSAKTVCCSGSGAIRRTIHFSGSVQGVGFRYTTRELASRFKVTGLVRNLSDGRVELVAEGSEVELDRFQCEVERAMKPHIRDTAESDSPATGQFKNFSIAQ